MGAMVHHNDGGYATARVSAAQQDREARCDREAAALAYLHRKGLDVPDANGVNVAEVLGLIESPPPKRKRRDPITDGRRR